MLKDKSKLVFVMNKGSRVNRVIMTTGALIGYTDKKKFQQAELLLDMLHSL